MTTQEKRALVQLGYRALMASLDVEEAWEAYRKAEEEYYNATQKWLNIPDHTTAEYYEAWAAAGNACTICGKKEGLFKKAVNRYLKLVGRDPEKWDSARDARKGFNRAIEMADNTNYNVISFKDFLI